MLKEIEKIKEYFQAPENYFWHWADGGEVAEWGNGTTLCYRDDLIAVFKDYPGKAVPPFSAILMVLTACRNTITVDYKLIIIEIIHRFGDHSLYKLLDSAIEFMQLINKLPVELRNGQGRVNLVRELFEGADTFFSGVQLKNALDELNSGRLDTIITEKKAPVTKEQFIKDLVFLEWALKRFATAKKLELKLRTGLYALPPQANIVFQDETAKADLLEQLAEDSRTKGIAKLSRKLVSVLNIPLHSQGSGDHSYGGISDITNRGNYDRLLLSELAQDDALLMARLVNNEALYYRREEPPDNPKKQRTILLDASLKMWGMPRIFAISAALAFIHNSKHGESIAGYVLEGTRYHKVDLSVKEGIIQSMEIFDHSLHCGKALESVIADIPSSDNNEYVLFTDNILLANAGFHASLQNVLPDLRFIIGVSRNGEIHFLECNNGRTKILNTAKIDLEELLFDTINEAKPLEKGNERLPAFFLRKPAPLLFPKIRLKQAADRMAVMGSDGILAVNENQRLLWMMGKDKGAYEILGSIERGVYTFGHGLGKMYLMVANNQRKFFKLLTVDGVTMEVATFQLPEEIDFVRESIIKAGELYILTYQFVYVFDCNFFTRIKKEEILRHSFDVGSEKIKNDKLLTSALANSFFASNTWRYSAIYKMRDLYISTSGKLVLGNAHVDLVWKGQHIRVQENVERFTAIHYSRVVNSDLKLISNKSIKFCKRVWTDGSEAIIDSRGLLHLKSAGKNIPEITIVLVTGVHTACWASDGATCGSAYFLPNNQTGSMSCDEFYKKYIQLFIGHVTQYATTVTI